MQWCLPWVCFLEDVVRANGAYKSFEPSGLELPLMSFVEVDQARAQ